MWDFLHDLSYLGTHQLDYVTELGAGSRRLVSMILLVVYYFMELLRKAASSQHDYEIFIPVIVL